MDLQRLFRSLLAAATLSLACGCSEPAARTSTTDAAPPDTASPAAQAGASNLASVLGMIPKSVLWVGAHPDDEGYVASLLLDACNLHGAACTFLVVTDGGKGNCKLGTGACGTADSGGAPPGSVGAFRVAEMQSVAASYHGTLIELALEDTASATVVGDAQNWNQTYSHVPNDASIALIQQKFADVLTTVKPDVVLTFDPRHGVYCHPDHRAVGALTLSAAQQVAFDYRRIFLIESAEIYLGTDGSVHERAWVPGDPLLRTYDAASAGTWHARVDDYLVHKSQYLPSDLVGYSLVAPAEQTLSLLQLSTLVVGGMVPPSPAYDAICASENARWDGHGVCPKGNDATGPCF